MSPAPSTHGGSYRPLKKEDLLSNILGETETEAARQERHISDVLRQRAEAEQRDHVEHERQRRQAVQDALRLEEERRQRARAKREAVLREIEEEDRRLSGEWTAVAPAAPSPPTTDQYAAATRADNAFAAEHLRAEAAFAARSARRWRLWAGAAGAALAVGLVWMLATPGVDVDPGQYPKSLLTVVSFASPQLEVAVADLPNPPHAHGRGRADSGSARADDDARGAAARRDHRTQPQPDGQDTAPADTQAAPLSISLDHAEDLWRRGSD